MKQKGQTMIEGMVAIFIILVGIISALILAVAAFSSSSESENQVKATNFAREALEVIRNKRDTNWLASSAFDNGLDYYHVRVNFNPSNNTWSIDQINTSEFNPLICQEVSGTCQLYYNPDNGVFNHEAGGTQATNFYRVLEINNICRIPTELERYEIKANGESCAWPTYKVGFQVLAKVVWQETTQQREVVLEDRLFDWR